MIDVIKVMPTAAELAAMHAQETVSETLPPKAVKHDQDKPRMELLSPVALQEMAIVLGIGAVKYGDHNWANGFKWSRLYGAILRHLLSHMGGEDKDPETGRSHLAHAACGLMFLIEHEVKGLGNDDRKTTP